MLEVGMKAPAFSLPDQNGEIHTLEDYKGKRLFYISIRKTALPDVRNRPVVLRICTRSLWKRGR